MTGETVPRTKEELEMRLDSIQAPPPPPPTVGRIVHFYPMVIRMDDKLPDPQAAIVTYVHNVANVNAVALEVFGYPEKVIHRGVPYSPKPKAGCWSWPPR
jgi:hypothetical protein